MVWTSSPGRILELHREKEKRKRERKKKQRATESEIVLYFFKCCVKLMWQMNSSVWIGPPTVYFSRTVCLWVNGKETINHNLSQMMDKLQIGISLFQNLILNENSPESHLCYVYLQV